MTTKIKLFFSLICQDKIGCFMDNSYSDLQKLLDAGRNPPSSVEVGKIIENSERLKTILEMAYQTALKKGIESEMRGFSNALRTPDVQRNLDAIYNFSPLILQDRVVPPVITEAKNIPQNKNGVALKTTGTIYSIEKQAYFSTLPPNWRTYLNIPDSKYATDYSDIVSKEFMPKNSSEYALWRDKTISGFTEGQKVAQQMFTSNLNRLNRDYIGMIRFHEFVIDGKITMPSLSRSDIAISNTGKSLLIDQKLLTIKNLPSFEGNMLKWSTWQSPLNTSNNGKQEDSLNDLE